jgi:hypothetical protein
VQYNSQHIYILLCPSFQLSKKAVTTTVEDVEDVVIVTMNDVTEEAGGMIAEVDTVVIATIVIIGVVLGLAVALRDIVVVVPPATAAEAVPAALDIVEGIMMIAVPLTVGDLGIMIGDMNVLNVDMEMGGRYC